MVVADQFHRHLVGAQIRPVSLRVVHDPPHEPASGQGAVIALEELDDARAISECLHRRVEYLLERVQLVLLA